jgi:hypothetical protein
VVYPFGKTHHPASTQRRVGGLTGPTTDRAAGYPEARPATDPDFVGTDLAPPSGTQWHTT